MVKILCVCTGNICRSPTAEGVLRQYAQDGHWDDIYVDSAGTHAYHVGEPPDTRSVAAAKRRGFDIADLRARKVDKNDFYGFDLILGLDYEHVRLLRRMAPPDATAQSALFLNYAGVGDTEVPDPYYGSSRDFEMVLDVIETGSRALLEKLKSQK